MPSSKMDHKELQRRLKEDELSVFMQMLSSNTRSFLDRHGRQLFMTIGLILVVILAIYFWRMKAESDFNQSQILLGNATALIGEENYQAAINELNTIIGNFSGQELSAIALVLRGDCQSQQGNYAEALKDYESALPSLNEVDSIPVRIAIIQTRRSLGQHQQALAEIEKLQQNTQTETMKNQILYLKGGVYEDMEQNEQALEAYKAIDKDSDYYSQAVQRIEWLEAKPVGAIN